MVQRITTRGGDVIELWQCLNCGRIRRVDSANVHQIFTVEPDYCNVKCKRLHQQRHDYVPSGQMSLLEQDVL